MNQQTQDIITNFFAEILGEEPQLFINQDDTEISVDLELNPELSGVMIGYRGEVLAAMQLILSLIVQTHTGEWVPVRVNVNNYREQRAEALANLAQNTARRVLDSGTPLSIPNLSSYERRLIHSILSEIEGVASHSEGEGINRVLIVSPV